MKKQEAIVRKYCTMMIVVCCLSSLIFSNLYIAINGDHINHKHCGQAGCSVCVNISHANGLLHNIRLISSNAGSISVPALFFLVCICLVRTQIFAHFTLVKMKTRLDN